MKDDSHNSNYFNRYIRLLDEIFDIDYVIAWELYEVNTPYDLTINDEINIEVKIQKCDSNKVGLEQYTDHHNNKRGWVHKLKENDVDYVLFFYPESNYYFLVDAGQLQEWWKNNCDSYTIHLNRVSKDSNGNIWQSSFSYIFVKDIPEDIIVSTNIKREEIGFDAWM
jgi:hypothetical protein